MESQGRKEMALKVVLLIVSALSIAMIIVGVMLLRESTPEEITGARYVISHMQAGARHG